MSLVEITRWSPLSDPVSAVDGRQVVLLEDDVFDPELPGMNDVFNLGPIFIAPTRHPEMMARALDPFAPEQVVPALLQERMSEYDDDAMRAFCLLPAAHRALVVRPRERIHLGLIGIMPKAWAPGYRPFYTFIDLVVLVGPQGLDAWQVHPAWAREIRDEALHCAPHVDFVFAGWGRHQAEGVFAWEGRVQRHTLDGEEHRNISWL